MMTSALVEALVAGAVAAASNVGGEALKDAYEGLKRVLIDAYNIVSGSILDKHPKEEFTKQALTREIDDRPDILDDPIVRARAEVLRMLLEAVSPEERQRYGIFIRKVTAQGDIVAEAPTIEGEEYTSRRGSISLTAKAPGDTSPKK